VFLEAGRRCHGGAGMLWMYCPTQFSLCLEECLHRLEKLYKEITPQECIKNKIVVKGIVVVKIRELFTMTARHNT